VAKTISGGLVDDSLIDPVVIFAGLVGATWVVGGAGAIDFDAVLNKIVLRPARAGARRAHRRDRHLRGLQNGGPDPGARTPPVISVRVMTPMVFCASLVPCASASVDDERR
jgi:hypothetical protein